jgi:hypothetical protein
VKSAVHGDDLRGTGAMANGIGSVEIVQAMASAGMLGFFGAACFLMDVSAGFTEGLALGNWLAL